MKGIYDKTAIFNVVKPLKAMASVLQGGKNKLRVVFESEEDGVYVSLVSQTGTVYILFKLNPADLIKDFEPTEDVGIWDVKQFMDIMDKYSDDIYSDDLEIDRESRKLIISCGNEKTELVLGEPSIFAETRLPKRNFESGKFNEGASFGLDDVELKKIIKNMSVFSDLDRITFKGNEGDTYASIILTSSNASIKNKNVSRIEGVPISSDFEIAILKGELLGFLNSFPEFNFEMLTSERRNCVVGTYQNSQYQMKCIFNEITNAELDD